MRIPSIEKHKAKERIKKKAQLGLYLNTNHVFSYHGITDFIYTAVRGIGKSVISVETAIILKRDVLPQVTQKCKASEKWLIVLILALACALSMGPLGDTILNFSYMSMALRGATLFVPLCFAIFCRGRVSPRFATVAIIAGPLLSDTPRPKI